MDKEVLSKYKNEIVKAAFNLQENDKKGQDFYLEVWEEAKENIISDIEIYEDAVGDIKYDALSSIIVAYLIEPNSLRKKMDLKKLNTICKKIIEEGY